MTRKARTRQGGKRVVERRRVPGWVVFGMVLAVMTMLTGSWWFGARPAITLSSAATAAVPGADFKMLKGRWQRSDGGYVLEIKGVWDSGMLEAAYFNPNAIHVAIARASQTSGATRVFIELRDVNYPGSIYDLIYDASGDRLEGTYFQAIARKTYQVSFSRLNLKSTFATFPLAPPA